MKCATNGALKFGAILVRMMMIWLVIGNMQVNVWKKEVQVVCVRRTDFMKWWAVCLCVCVHVKNSIIVSQMVRYMKIEKMNRSESTLPVQVIGGILSCIFMMTVQVVDNALHLLMTFVALLFQYIVVHHCQQIFRYICFSPQLMIG